MSATSQQSRRDLLAKLRLGLILVAFSAAFLAVADLVARSTSAIASQQATELELLELYLFGFGYGLIFFMLASMPLTLVISYRDVQSDVLMCRADEELSLCGVDQRRIAELLHELSRHSTLAVVALPMLLNLLFMYLIWALVLFPHGLGGILEVAASQRLDSIALARTLTQTVREATALSWTLLGVYMYALNVLIRRWMQHDLTTGVVWWLNMRIAIAFVFGLLLMALESTDALVALGPWVSAFAFVVGLLPDALLRWMNRGLTASVGVAGSTDALLSSPTLARLIPGMSYWQMDRLSEEGISSVQDLASKNLVELILKTRFDTPLLLYWVDRAILCDLAGNQLDDFDRGGILTASHLLYLVREGPGLDAVVESLRDAKRRWLRCNPNAKEAPDASDAGNPSSAMLANLVASIEARPNIGLIRAYLSNSRARIKPACTDTRATGGLVATRDAAGVGADSASGASGAGRRRFGSRRGRNINGNGNGMRSLLAVLMVGACLGLFIAIAHLIAVQAVSILQALDTGLTSTDIYAFAFNYGLLLFLLITLPTLMVIGYRGVKGRVLIEDMRRVLARVGLAPEPAELRIRLLHESQSLGAYLLAMLVNLSLLYVTWSMALLPTGLDGLIDLLPQFAAKPPLSASSVLLSVAKHTTPLAWVMIGSYFYAILVITQRWLRSDMHAGMLWQINVRLAIAFVIGLLVVEMFSFAEADLGTLKPSLAAFAFICGVFPDAALRLVARRLRALGALSRGATELFAGPDLQARIPGMSFWEQERLAEFDVETVGDLASKDLVELMLRTRFSPDLLLRWINQALLLAQVGPEIARMRAAHLDSATLIFWFGSTPAGRAHLIRSYREALQVSGAAPGCAITPALLENLISGLGCRLNLHYLLAAERAYLPAHPSQLQIGPIAPRAPSSASASTDALDAPSAATAQSLPAAQAARARLMVIGGLDPSIDFDDLAASGYSGLFQYVDGAAIRAGIGATAEQVRRAGMLWGVLYRLDPDTAEQDIAALLERVAVHEPTLLAIAPQARASTSATDRVGATMLPALDALVGIWSKASGRPPGLCADAATLVQLRGHKALASCWLWLRDDADLDAASALGDWTFRGQSWDDRQANLAELEFRGDEQALRAFWVGTARTSGTRGQTESVGF